MEQCIMVQIKMKPIIFILVCLLFLPLIVSADTCGNGVCETFTHKYGSWIYGSGLYGLGGISESCSSCPADCGICPGGGEGGGGGGGGGSQKPVVVIEETESECIGNSDCELNQYCLNGNCHDAECIDDSACNIEEGEVCFGYKCTKLFDIEILEFESPVKLGDFFDFTYYIKGMADIKGDVEIDFWIESDGKVVTSGKDTIYLGAFEDRTKTKKLFLPSDTESGAYTFKIEVTFEDYTARAHRTIEIAIVEGLATINLLPEYNLWLYILLFIVLGIILVFIIFYSKRIMKKIFLKSPPP